MASLISILKHTRYTTGMYLKYLHLNVREMLFCMFWVKNVQRS